MDRAKFFAAVRSSLFGGSLSQAQVSGMTAILDEAQRRGSRTNDLAYALATTFHETARTMQPVRETMAKSDQQAIRILDRAYAAGKMKGVSRPYWRRDAEGKSWLGRGLVQLTHRDNYAKTSAITGIDLVAAPDRAMEMPVAVKILFDGMEKGTFTGLGFNSFIDGLDESDDLDRAEFRAARKIINGKDKADLIAGYALSFERALRNAAYLPVAIQPRPRIPEPPAPTPAEAKPVVIDRAAGQADRLTAIINAILALLKGNKA